ncbi:type IV pilus assembly protein PilM [Leifsonia sp. WHRI 6310E]|uniref:type IV pilus assembly protein PilM n=1 Tax=Leifsonia sp. WHRI 6310E TaxID=3162562 RepID=UPI0032EDFD9F
MVSRIVGVDIGSEFIRAAELEGTGRSRPTLVRFQEIRLPDGAVQRGEVLEPHTVATVLRQLWSRGRFRSREVVLGIGNQRVLARDLTVPKASRERIREALPFQVQDLLPVPVGDALLDFYPVSESVGEHGAVLNGLLIAAVKDAVLGNVNAAQLAGLKAADVDLIPFALTRALLPAASTGTVVLIDIGASTTSVVVLTDGIPQFVRLIPAGGSDLTAALSSRLEIGLPQAEQVKRTLGLASKVASLEEQRAVEVVYEVTGELLSSLRNTINYFANTRPGVVVSSIVLNGGGAQLPGLPEALGELTRLPVVEADPYAGIALSRTLDAETLRTARPSAAVAVGLAIGAAA